jgi:structural maintenance of chromosome 3 (chondroitin sulfate proteoglycan 6)
MQQHQTKLRDIQQTIQLHEAEKKDLQDEREHLMKTRAQLELLVKDLEDSQMSDEQYQSTMEAQLQELEQTIAAEQEQLNAIQPQFKQLTEEGQRLRTEMRTLQAEQQHMHAKQARASKFGDKASRDAWLTTQINDITHNLTVRQSQLNQLEQELQEANAELNAKARQVQESKEKYRARYQEREALANEEISLRIERDEATEERKALWREEARMDSVLRNCSDEMRKSERTLASSMDKVKQCLIVAYGYVLIGLLK